MKIEINKVMRVYDVVGKQYVKMVSHIDTTRIFPVICEDGSAYGYCEDMKNDEGKNNRMTNRQLSRWLAENPGREWKVGAAENMCVSRSYNYIENMADEAVSDNVLVRQDGGEWKAPEVGVSW